MDMDNVNSYIKDEGQNIMEDGDIFVEEGEIHSPKEETATNKRKGTQKEESEPINRNNKAEVKNINNIIPSPQNKFKLSESDSLVLNTHIKSTDSFISKNSAQCATKLFLRLLLFRYTSYLISHFFAPSATRNFII